VPAGQAAQPLRLAVEAIGVDTEVLPYTAEDAAAGRDGLTGQGRYEDGVIVCVDPPLADAVYWQRGGLDGASAQRDPRQAGRLHHIGRDRQAPARSRLSVVSYRLGGGSKGRFST
jgi:hypothetical protein